jgi:tRNA G10  N-methylase Trm11
MFYAFDIDANAIEITRKKISEELIHQIVVKKVDIRNINRELSTESIDKIITDPPWGIFEKIEEGIQRFYDMILNNLTKLLKKDGRMIILSAKKDECEKAISTIKCLKIESIYNILVSGKKSSIYCIVKE